MRGVNIDEQEEVTVQMGPLIDCVFLLLIFFMVVALTKKSHKQVEFTHKPMAAVVPSSDEKDERFVVGVNSKGQVSVSGAGTVAVNSLSDALMKKASEDSDVKVWVEPSPNLSVQQIMPVLDSLKIAGLDNIVLRIKTRY